MTYWVEKWRYYGKWVGGEPEEQGTWFDESRRKKLRDYSFETRSEAVKKAKSLTPSYGKSYFDEIKVLKTDKYGDVVSYIATKDPGDV